MKLVSTTAVCITLAISIIAGCSKDDDNNNSNTGTKTSLLTSGSWKQTSVYIDPAIDLDGDGQLEHEIFNFQDACDKDDLLFFKSDGNATFDEGPTKCDPSDPQIIESSKWKFIDNESKIVVTDNNNISDTVQLAELSSTILKIRTTSVDQSIVFTETITYMH